MPHPDDAPSGVIHDIGFRHYSGPRLGRRHITQALFLDSLRGAYGIGRSTRSKVMPLLLLAGVCLPALVVAIQVNVTSATRLPVTFSEYTLATNPLTALYVAGQAPASVSRDLRFRVVSLYFSRPLSRSDYVHAKYAALAVAVLLLTSAPLLLLYAGALLANLPFWATTRGLATGLAGTLLLSVVVAGLGLVIAAVTPRRGLGVAAVIALFVMTIAVQGALQSLGERQDSATLAGYAGLVSPFTIVNGILVWAFHANEAGAGRPPASGGGLVFLAAYLVVTAGCYGLLRLRYRRISVS